MMVFDAVQAAREGLAGLPRPLGFVPTMGALHDGHLSLIRAARERCESVAVSVFVNPMQFGAGEDFESYPRDLESDRAKIAAEGVDVLFTPGVDVMYPSGFSTIVDAGAIGTAYEGAIRPTHFRGVATVVTKLLHVMAPDVLFLGQKDAQQTAVLRKVIAELNLAVDLRIVPTVREADGLALSSRNVYLSERERSAAPSFYASLRIMFDELQRGSSAADARRIAQANLAAPAQWEYLDLVNALTFAPLESVTPPAFVVGAVRLGKTRLIDNILIGSA